MKLLLISSLFYSLTSEASRSIPIKPKANSLHEAVYNKDIERVKKLIKEGENVNIRGELGETSLHWLRKDSLEIAKLLIDNGADVNAKTEDSFGTDFDEDLISIPAGSTPLHLAIKKNADQSLISFLLKQRADVNAVITDYGYEGGFTPLHLASNEGNLKIVALLLENGADVNAGKGTIGVPLRYASMSLKISKALIDAGADVNSKDSSGYTPLHQVGTIKVAELLLKHGANINAETKDDSFDRTFGYNTPCDSVTSEEVKKFLKEQGGFCWKFTFLHQLVMNNNDRAVIHRLKKQAGFINSLLKRKSRRELHARENKYGNTPLHFAENLGIAKALIKHGADVNAINNKGQTPFDTIDSEEVKKYLKENGGKSGQALESKPKAQESKKESLWIKIKNLFKRGG
ncbi:MAG: ankyrin repeat domain-containing protein [Oligoflexia bacterium]|nr:ankyrin repeat domain-containing protein [Oligoflexia bacterium]